MNSQAINSDIFSAMQTEKPYKRYKKVILGKVYLTVLNPFSMQPDGMILQGNPRTNDKGCFIEVWTPQEDVFLRRMNEVHFNDGTLVEWKEKSPKKEKTYSEYSEDDVVEIINSHHLTLSNTLNKINSEAFLLRLLSKAEELEKSDKIIKRIEARLSEVQYAVDSE